MNDVMHGDLSASPPCPTPPTPPKKVCITPVKQTRHFQTLVWTSCFDSQGSEDTSGGRFQGETSACLECNYLTLFTSANVRHELAWKINCNTGEHSWQGGQCYARCGAHQRQSWRSQCVNVSPDKDKQRHPWLPLNSKASREKSCLMLLCPKCW